MYYSKHITIPANTSQADPVTTIIKLTEGTIKRVDVGFPTGCAGLAHVQVYHSGWLIVPWTRRESLAWDGHVFQMPQSYPITDAPRRLKVLSWNDDTDYPHTVFVAVVFDEGKPDDLAKRFLDDLKRMSGL